MTTDPAEDALAALARDLIEEIAAGRALELAQVRPYERFERGHEEHVRGYIPKRAWQQGQQEWEARGEAIWAANQWKPRTGAGAVHPQLGSHLAGHPGDTISGHAYRHVPRPLPGMVPNPNLPQAPLEQPLQGHQPGELLSGPEPGSRSVRSISKPTTAGESASARTPQPTAPASPDMKAAVADAGGQMLSSSGTSHWVAAFGDPYAAQHVLTYVPGVGTDAGGPGEMARGLVTRAVMDARKQGSTAVVVWHGYIPPPTIEHALSKKDAIDAARDLTSFEVDLRKRNPDAHLTVLGHSYGSLVAGEAARRGMKADDLILLASPGAGASRADELGAAGHVWAGIERRDPIGKAADLLKLDFGGSTVAPKFGARVFAADSQENFPGLLHLEAHSSYWDAKSAALLNIANIATGQYSKVTGADGASPSGRAAEAAAVKKIAQSPEGFSVNPRTGEEPAGGYMVARTGNTHTYPEAVLKDPDKLAKVIDQMIMSGGFPDGTYLGGWVHDGKLWLEPSDNVADKARAEKLGQRRNQIAIWDVAGGQEIQTGGTGGGRITEHDAAGNVVRTYQEGSRADTGGLPEAARAAAAEGRAPAGGRADQANPPDLKQLTAQLNGWVDDAYHNEWMDEYSHLKRAVMALNGNMPAEAAGELRKAALAAKKKGDPGAGRATNYRGIAELIKPARSAPGSPLKPDRQLFQDITAEAKQARWDYEDDIAADLEYAARVVETAKPGTNWRNHAHSYLKRALDRALANGQMDRAHRIGMLDDRVKGLDEGTPQAGSAQAAMVKAVTEAAAVVPGLLGPHARENAFNGKVQVVPSALLDSPATLAQMDWDGTMKIREDVAKTVQSDLEHPGQTISDPTQHVVILHELIHGIVPPRSERANRQAYQDYANAQIEEGFTELGAIYHAPEYFEKMGIGDRETQVIGMQNGRVVPSVARQRAAEGLAMQLEQVRDELVAEEKGPVPTAPWDAVARKMTLAAAALRQDNEYGIDAVNDAVTALRHLGTKVNAARAAELASMAESLDKMPVSEHATMTEYARRVQDPVRIASGDGFQIWGHYPGQVKDAQDWVQQVAKEEGYADLTPGTDGQKRVIQLADQINEQGAAGKVETMARQMAFATVKDPKLRNDVKFMDGLMDSSEEIIHEEWGKDGDLPPAKRAFVSGRHFVKTQVNEALTSDTYTGATEAQARAAETGAAGKEAAV